MISWLLQRLSDANADNYAWLVPESTETIVLQIIGMWNEMNDRSSSSSEKLFIDKQIKLNRGVSTASN